MGKPRTLVMRWTETFEWRVAMSDSPHAAARALDLALSNSGIYAHSRPNIDPESIRFVIERD